MKKTSKTHTTLPLPLNLDVLTVEKNWFPMLSKIYHFRDCLSVDEGSKRHEFWKRQNSTIDQPDFRGPRPTGRNTPDIGRVATCRLLHEIYSNVHQLATCWIYSNQSIDRILQVAIRPISGVSLPRPAGRGPLKSGWPSIPGPLLLEGPKWERQASALCSKGEGWNFLISINLISRAV